MVMKSIFSESIPFSRVAYSLDIYRKGEAGILPSGSANTIGSDRVTMFW